MGNAFSTKTYLLVVLLVFLVLAVMTIASAEQAYLTTTPTVASQTQQHVNAVRHNITPQSIFLNNFFVSIPVIIPVAGLILFGRVWINTGQALGQLAYSYGVSPLLYVINVYVPVGIIESLAYSVIIAESLFLTFALAKGTLKERLKNQTWKSLILYVVLLAIAATVEAELIWIHY
jgi:uncharacterized membrane protein SpoIIM required for sporulation